MKYINDKTINCPVSKIGLGVARFGTKVDKELSFQMLDCFVKEGGTLLDTARNYYEWAENGRGKSETCVGKWIEDRGNRDKICIVTKGGVKNEGNTFYCNLKKDNLYSELKQSLEALRTDYIDIYLLHRDQPDCSEEEIIDTMQYIAEQGKIGKIGVANWSINRIKKANIYARKHSLKEFSVIQTWWSLAEYTDSMWNDSTTTHMDKETYNYIKENSYIGMAYTSQCKGFFQKAIENGLDNIDEFLKKRIVTPTNLKKLDHIKKYCKKNEVTATAYMNSYITSNEANGVALVSTSKLQQLQDILSTSDYCLPQEELRNIDNVI